MVWLLVLGAWPLVHEAGHESLTGQSVQEAGHLSTGLAMGPWGWPVTQPAAAVMFGCSVGCSCGCSSDYSRAAVAAALAAVLASVLVAGHGDYGWCFQAQHISLFNEQSD